MADRYVPADRSVLLDYISPMLIVSLFKSLKNRHFLVVLTISEFILIKILVILSTGLLVLESIPIKPTNITLQTSGKFDGSTFDPSYVDSGPALAALAIQSYSMPYPMFSNERYAVQSIDLPATWSDSSAGVLATTVEYFGADLDCEEAAFNYPSITSSSCNATIYSFKVPSYSGYVAVMRPAICPTNVELDVCKRSGEDDLSIQLMVILAFSDGNEIVNATTLLCKPLYELGRAEVIMNRTTAYSEGITIQPIAGLSNQTLNNVPQQDLARGVLVSLLDLVNLQATAFHLHPTSESGYIDTFFNFILALDPARPIWELMDAQTLIRDVKSVYRSMAAQIARSHLMTNAYDSVPATFTGTGNRIVARKLAIRLMQGCCAVLSLMTALCMVLCPRGVLPRSVDCLAGHIAICARSTDAMKLFIATGQKPFSRLEQICGFYKFGTTAVSLADRCAFQIKAEISPNGQRKLCGTAAVEAPARQWWRPLPFSMPIMLLTASTPLVLIAVVESTFQASNAHHGLSVIDAEERFRYVWTFLPALLLTGVATLFNMLDFEVENILPYQTLRRGASSAESTIFTNFLGKTSVEAIWDGVRHKQPAVIATAISVIFAPLLTIAVSGLFTVEKVPTSQSGLVIQYDWFNSSSALGANSGAENIAELVSLYNMPFPQWTYGGLVLPRVDILPQKGSLDLDTFTTVEYTTPGLRGRMNCSSVVTLTSTTRIPGRGGAKPILPKTLVHFSPTQGDPCSFANGTTAGYTGTYTPSRGGGYFGQVYFYNYTTRTLCNDTIHLAFGNITGQDLDQLENVHTLRCFPYVEQVMVNVTLALPDLTIANGVPPVVLDDHPAKYFSDYSVIASGFPLEDVPVADSYDDFTKYLVYGRDAVPLGDLLPNTSRLIEAVELTYETYIAQMLNSDNVRISADASRNNSIMATFTDGNRQRLIQHGLSTRLLEGVLAILFLCAVVAYVSIWRSTKGTRRILPKNPCSIASVASLLAGSDLLNLVPPGTEFLSNNQMREQATFRGCFFRLGWWGESQRFGVDVGTGGRHSPPEIPRWDDCRKGG
jgi:hypothetical protein